MHGGQGYARFENPPTPGEEISTADKKSIANGVDIVDSPVSTPSSRSVILVDNGARTTINLVEPNRRLDAVRRRKYLQAWKFLRASAAVGLLLACSIVILEGFVDAVIAHDDDADNFGVCGLGTGIWAGLTGIVAGVLGVCAFRVVDGNKSLVVAHFVLLVVSSVSDCILIIMTAFCVDALPYVRTTHEWDHDKEDHVLATRSPGVIPVDQLLFAIGALLLLMAFIHALTSIVSAAIMCRTYWCTDYEPKVTVIYCQKQQVGAENGTTSAAEASGKASIRQSPESSNGTAPALSPSYDNKIVDTNDTAAA